MVFSVQDHLFNGLWTPTVIQSVKNHQTKNPYPPCRGLRCSKAAKCNCKKLRSAAASRCARSRGTAMFCDKKRKAWTSIEQRQQDPYDIPLY